LQENVFKLNTVHENILVQNTDKVLKCTKLQNILKVLLEGISISLIILQYSLAKLERML